MLEILFISVSFQLDPRIIRPFIAECRQTIANLDNQNMKAIKGLEDRLYALDQMIASCGRLVNEQKELAQVLIANSLGRGICSSSRQAYMQYQLSVHLCFHFLHEYS